MMKRPVPVAVVFAVALTIVALLPLYLERTMTRLWFANGSGGATEWNWKVCTLRTFFADYIYFRHNPHPQLWIAMNIALALAYASVITLVVCRIFERKPDVSWNLPC